VHVRFTQTSESVALKLAAASPQIAVW